MRFTLSLRRTEWYNLESGQIFIRKEDELWIEIENEEKYFGLLIIRIESVKVYLKEEEEFRYWMW